jgi:hypothetical protein
MKKPLALPIIAAARSACSRGRSVRSVPPQPRHARAQQRESAQDDDEAHQHHLPDAEPGLRQSLLLASSRPSSRCRPA